MVIQLRKVVDNVYIVNPYNPNVQGCCVYMVDTKSDDGLVLIDAGMDIEPIQAIEKDGFNLKDIKHCLITHGHIDHYGICYKLKEFNNDIKFYAHELDVKNNELKITDPYIAQMYGEYKYEPIKIDRLIKNDNELLKFGNYEFKCIHIPGHTPGSIAYLLEASGKKILFGGDVPGIAINFQDGNLNTYLKSMQKLLELKIDISCEGHEHIIQPAEKVLKFIKGYMKFNKNLNIVAIENPSDIKALLEAAFVSNELGFYPMTVDFCNYLLEIEPENIEAQKLLKEAEKHNPEKFEWIKSFIKRVSNSK
ncbi:MAG: MBL fold metallo-hydrolase [Promethearchaeota archaeon]|nr:MAG: MBL fold metallo-hydrolase [Candidatus Lokiarchaeota archaeon]